MTTIPTPIMKAVSFAEIISAKRRTERIGRLGPIIHRSVGTVFSLALFCSGIGCSENDLLVPDPAVRYLAFGDSATSGPANRDYPDILVELLGQAPETFAKQGKGGETTSEGLERLRQLISLKIYPNAHTLLYWEGGADIIDLIQEVDGLLLFSPTASDYPDSERLLETLDDIQADMETAITEGQAAGLTVYVATYFSLREALAQCDPLLLNIILPSQARNANDYISLLNERIRQAAVNQGATVVDIASADDILQADDANYFNCNHLSEQGNEIVARLFAEALGQETRE